LKKLHIFCIFWKVWNYRCQDVLTVVASVTLPPHEAAVFLFVTDWKTKE
jgi:hypothetical protein